MDEKNIKQSFYIEKRDDDEINIFELIEIFSKNLKLFTIISILGIICTGIFIAKRIHFDKNNIATVEYKLNTHEVELKLKNKMYYSLMPPENLFKNEKFINELFKIKELNELFKKTSPLNHSIESRRTFLKNSKIITLSKIPNEKDSYILRVKVNRNIDGNKKYTLPIIENCIKITEDYYSESFSKVLFNKKQELEDSLVPLEKKLNENKLNEKAIKLYNNNNNNNNNNNMLLYTDPEKISRLEIYSKEYKETLFNLVILNSIFKHDKLSDLKVIKLQTSIFYEEEKSKNILFLLGGLGISIVIALGFVFIKELYDNYKKFKLKM